MSDPTQFIQLFTGPSLSYLGIKWPSGSVPSGRPGNTLDATLISMRAQFGFNNEPHQFELEFIPQGSGWGHGASGQLPDINTELSFQISGFYIRGLISHTDWASNDGGTIFSVSLKDKRNTLDTYKLTTEDLGSGIPSGVISVPREWRLLNGLTQEVFRMWPSGSGVQTVEETETIRANFKEYERMIDVGCTWTQILSAIQNTIGSGLTSKLPSVNDIQSNIGGNIDSLRFKFENTTLREVVSKLTSDSAFDWYWNMGNDKVSLINKKTPFLVPESNLLTLINAYGGSGIDNIKRLSYGKDVVEEPTRFQLLGAKQEGVMNSPLLSPIDGLDTIYDGITPSSTLVFYPAWTFLTVGFYDASGFFRTYIPGSLELQMSLAGIEQWSYFKKYQTSSAPSGWGLSEDEGSIAAQHPDFQSRLDPRQPLAEILSNPSGNLRVINNRRDLNSNWVIEFFNRISQHAQRHFGKSYIATNALTRNDRVFTLIDKAWCNVENQREVPSGLFVDDYEISHQYGPIAPFFGEDAKVSAFVRLPSGTVYGPLGEDSPTSFANWTEDAYPFNASGDGSHYIPCDLSIVGQRSMDPRKDEAFSFEKFPEQTIWCQLPEIAASGVVIDSTLGNLATLTEYAFQLGQSGIIDIIDPSLLVVPYQFLSGVAIPVQAQERYGQNYPTIWASGTPHPIYGTRVEVDENFAPWIEFPEGSENSVQKTTRQALDKVSALVAQQNESQFMEIEQVGLPKLSFDSFADQSPNLSGLIGERVHGVTNVSITYGNGGLTTLYKIQSYYENTNKAYPLKDRTRFRINGVIHPIDFTDLGNFLASFGRSNGPSDISANSRFGAVQFNFDFERQESCTIIAIHNIFDEPTAEKYLNGQTVPLEESYYGVVNRRRQYVYGETNYTLVPGINQIGHNLNSLQVVAEFIASGIGNVPLPQIVVDPFTIAVSNNTGSNLFGTLFIFNGEGNIRPTQETIRHAAEGVDDYGAVCNDGFLNLGDSCTYFFKRVDGQEIAYFLGGRKLSPGTIVQVESIGTDGKYVVSILGDAHGRWMVGLQTLNSVPLATGTQTSIVGGVNQ